jgi:small subunit ribosomal protein S6e
MTFKICINEPKTRKSWQLEKELPSLIGLKIGDKFDGAPLGLAGFTLQITGGSDKDGFPMRPDLTGIARKKALMSSGPGFRPTVKGLKRRKYVRGNTISTEIVQVNCKVIEGEGDIPTILGIKPKEVPKEEQKTEVPTEEPKSEPQVEPKKEEEKNNGD